MKKIIFLVYILSVVLISSCSSSKDPFKATNLTGNDLEAFLNSSFGYGPVDRTDTIEEVFYSSNLIDGFNVSSPKNLGKIDGFDNYVIIVTENGKSTDDFALIVYFERIGSRLSVNYVERRIGKQKNIYDSIDKRNPVMLEYFPNGFFAQVALDRETQKNQLVEERSTNVSVTNTSSNDLPRNYSQYKIELLLSATDNPALLIIPYHGALGYDQDKGKWIYMPNFLSFYPVTGNEALLKQYENTSNPYLELENDRFIMYIQRKGRYVSTRGFNLNDINDYARYTKECMDVYTIQIDAFVSFSSMMENIPENTKKRIFSRTWAGAGTTDELFEIFKKGGSEAVNKFANDWVALGEDEARRLAGI